MVRHRQVPFFSPSHITIINPIAKELIDLFARDGQRFEQPVQRRSIGSLGRAIRRWPGAGKRCLASRSWDLLTISQLFTVPAGLLCARFGAGRGLISKSWKVWLSGEHASRPSWVTEATKIACGLVIPWLWLQTQKTLPRTVSN